MGVRSDTDSTSSRREEAEAAGRSAIDRDDLDAALASFREELDLARASGDEAAVIYGLFHTAWALRYGFGRHEEAHSLLEEATQRAADTGSERLIWPTLVDMADAEVDAGNWTRAASLAAEALAPTWELELPAGDMTFLIEIAAFAAAGGGAERVARELYETAAEARRHQDWDPNSVRVIRERSERLMEPAWSRDSDRPSAGREASRLSFDDAVALAISLPTVLQ
jgi:tetratricopeptide (TPR) repeat protein